jgi:hypothetical protein
VNTIAEIKRRHEAMKARTVPLNAFSGGADVVSAHDDLELLLQALEETQERVERMKKALEAIRDRHVPDHTDTAIARIALGEQT